MRCVQWCPDKCFTIDSSKKKKPWLLVFYDRTPTLTNFKLPTCHCTWNWEEMCTKGSQSGLRKASVCHGEGSLLDPSPLTEPKEGPQRTQKSTILVTYVFLKGALEAYTVKLIFLSQSTNKWVMGVSLSPPISRSSSGTSEEAEIIGHE